MGNRASYDGDPHSMNFEELFMMHHNSLKIDMRSVPVFECPKVVYARESPEFVVAWTQANIELIPQNTKNPLFDNDNGNDDPH